MIMEEIWKDVVGYKGIYKISSMGNLKSVERIDSLGHKRKEKILKPKTDKYGYIVYGLCKNRYGHKSAGGFKWKYYTTDNYLIGKLNNSLMDKGFSLRKAF